GGGAARAGRPPRGGRLGEVGRRAAAALPRALGVAAQVLALELEHPRGVVGELLGASVQEDPVAGLVGALALRLELLVAQLGRGDTLGGVVPGRSLLGGQSSRRSSSRWPVELVG